MPQINEVSWLLIIILIIPIFMILSIKLSMMNKYSIGRSTENFLVKFSQSVVL